MSPPASMAIRSGLGKFSAEALQSCAGFAQRSAARIVFAPSQGDRPGNRSAGPTAGRARAPGIPPRACARTRDLIVIEPQMPDYWPQTPKLADSATIVLSRFAYLRRRGNDMVLESPRASALFRICDPKIAAAICHAMRRRRRSAGLRRQPGFPGIELLALLLDCKSSSRSTPRATRAAGRNEGDENLVLWDFHDLLFHTHSTEGRQANPLGGLYPYADVIAPPPAVRPPWPGADDRSEPVSSRGRRNNLAVTPSCSRERHSTRDFDDQQPITLAELAQFLDSAARVQSRWTSKLDFDERQALTIDLHHTAVSGRRQCL